MAKKEFYDDGRSVADMSGIDRPRVFLPRIPKKEREQWNTEAKAQESGERREKDPFSKSERRSYVFGALGAGLLIGAVFVAAAAIAIALMLAFWL